MGKKYYPETDRKRYWEKPEEFRKKASDWYHENKDKFKTDEWYEKKREYSKEYYKKNKERLKNDQEKYRATPKAKEKARLKAKRMSLRWPEKERARQLAGRLAHKNNFCDKCKSYGRLQMHHQDYSKPLEVITLCMKCHMNEHGGAILAL